MASVQNKYPTGVSTGKTFTIKLTTDEVNKIVNNNQPSTANVVAPEVDGGASLTAWIAEALTADINALA